jgi:hypothetical protein
MLIPDKPLVVIACGNKKKHGVQKAIDLYTGSVFASVRTYARSITPDSNIFIISAKHGLIPSYKKLRPYNLRITESDLSAEQVKAQSIEYGVADHPNIIFVGGRDYFPILSEAIPSIRSLFGKNGILGIEASMFKMFEALKEWKGKVPE